jgi:hypothetical protein
MSGPQIHHIDPRGGRHPNSPPRSLLILPLLAILSVACLVFSEVEYLIPFQRLLQTPDETLPTKSFRFDGLWMMPKPLAKKNTDGALLPAKRDTLTLEQDKTTEEEKPEKPAFDRIVLLGERHSGTSYTTRMLGECFPDLDVSDFLVRYKHWFQPTPEYVVDAVHTHLKDKTAANEQEDMHKILDDWPKLAALEEPKTAFNKTLVIAMFRNAYDWLEAMRLGPHHWPNHFDMYRFPRAPVPDTTGNPWYGSHFLPWKNFLAANMTIGLSDNENQLCQNAYSVKQVSPCQVSKDYYPNSVKKDYVGDLNGMPDTLPFNAHNPIYEMDENNEPFENPLELRTAKMRNLMEIPKYWDVGGFMTLQHEEVNMKGSEFLLQQVSKIVGMESQCKPDPPKNQEMKVLNSDWQKWITEHVDWELEGKVGYQPRLLGAGKMPSEKTNGDDKPFDVALKQTKDETNNKPKEEPAQTLKKTKDETNNEHKEQPAQKLKQTKDETNNKPKEQPAQTLKQTKDEMNKEPKEQPAQKLKQTKDETNNEHKEQPSQGEAQKSKTKSKSSRKHAATKKSEKFDQIVLLGERHSGTSYTTRMLAKCFPSLDVSDFLVRYKHWFQPTPEFVTSMTEKHLKNNTNLDAYEDMHKIRDYWPKLASLENPKQSAFARTLVIVMFRNVYDWLEAMRLGPHHWPNHFVMYRFPNAPVHDTTGGNPWYGSNFLPWKNFLKANMTIGNGIDESHLCQNAYAYGQVSPCRVSKELYPEKVKQDYAPDMSAAPDKLPFNAHNPFYELDENGVPFENPLALRTAKIRNFMDIPNTWNVGGFMTLQHEDINEKGSGFLINQVSKLVGMEPSCEADPPMKQEKKKLDADWAEWISANADWEAEGLLGYKKRESSVKK